MKYAGLYHLNAYTYGDPTWFPDMDPELRAMFQRVTKGAASLPRFVNRPSAKALLAGPSDQL